MFKMERLTEKRKYREAVVDRIEGGRAVLVLDDGQTLDWPRDNLPSGVGEGTKVKLVMLSAADETRDREEMAKAVLNEILKVE